MKSFLMLGMACVFQAATAYSAEQQFECIVTEPCKHMDEHQGHCIDRVLVSMGMNGGFELSLVFDDYEGSTVFDVFGQEDIEFGEFDGEKLTLDWREGSPLASFVDEVSLSVQKQGKSSFLVGNILAPMSEAAGLTIDEDLNFHLICK